MTKAPGWLLCALGLSAVAALVACGGDDGRGNIGPSSTQLPAQTGAGRQGVRLQVMSVYDPVAGGEALTMLKPMGWASQGGVVWRNDLSNLASTSMRVYNSDGLEALEFFQIVPYTWQEGGITSFPAGTVYMGNYVQPPVREPVDFIARVILPMYRGSLDPRIVEWKEIQGVSQEVARLVQEPGVSKTVRASRVRVEYSINDTLMNEDFYLTLVFSQSPSSPGTLWGPERLYSFRAPAGELDEVAPLMQAMVSSTRVNRQWFNQHMQVSRLWSQGQMQAIQSADDLSRYLAQVSDDISAITAQAYERQREGNDRIYQDFSEAIRGIETYDNPFGDAPVELPGGYADVWASETGEFILSNDAGFDPNTGSTVNWRLLRPQ